ncbi:transcriptional regulator, HxlR family [Devosia sp. YR412]|uniref:winged helix-turn-helix transcriptional regulator n=1 Tax=Devosia sp. YR412 TaxID=1881030 RepID=UPI0008B651C6|nr:helix-turn-helix domain-containing protein [Devosia sp. YR412]SEQ10332.1 transcriptional regulator, HxlR family [Devosia sp. YR412]
MADYTPSDHSVSELQSPRGRLVLSQIADKWSFLILTVLCTSPCRFNELKRRLDGITQKSLTDSLKRLERSGLIQRHVLPTRPVGVEYHITPLGKSLSEPFLAIAHWIAKNSEAVVSAQSEYDREQT